ncbi:hypothetical protein ES695_21395 [Candidatus Atribacteria bacterium 1244-E10-H5-B2]|nr:MAG: hypothetical protein ES695_21395 [Candidatus Atribacteria bacterium 1244-E10-H5-B2]
MKKFRKYIILSTLIFILVSFSSISIYAWDNCPFGFEDDPYPGECKRYIDTDGDGICDLSQPAPEDRDTSVSLNEENIKENTEDDNKYFKETDEKVTGGLFIAEAASTQKTVSDSPSPERKSLPSYYFLEIFFITLLIYFGGKFLARKLEITLCKEKKFWNIFLLISFIGSAGTGMILVFIRDYDWFKSINFNFLFWHVEFSIVMTLLGIFHALWHLKYYLSIFKKKKKDDICKF